MPNSEFISLAPSQPGTSLARLGGVAAAAVLALLAACSGKPAATEPVRAVRTVTVGALSGATTRDYAGEVHARVETRLGFRVPGKITQRPVNAGDRVKAGQALAEVDPTDLRLG